jgi:NADPH-dependent 2,4-dienoyl-CoA reductase/sulfur reductase-like enzyme
LTVDLVIVGAGPAGVSAAIEATERDLSVAVLDENPASGGRIWQALEIRGTRDGDDEEGLATLRAFRACGATVHHHASVWAVEPDGSVYFTQDGAVRIVRGQRVLLATGAAERPLPIPGWTLPGVMTVGAAQIALKTSGLVPDGMTWIAGQGPLLLLYAVQAIRAGGRLAGVLDLSDRRQRWTAAQHLPLALRGLGELRKGLDWWREIAHAGIPWLPASELRADGDGALQRIVFQTGGRSRAEPATLLLLHDGVVPSLQITRALGCDHRWDAAQQCWHPVSNEWGETSVPRVFVAGDGAGIIGAKAATLAGRLAALGIAHDLGRIDRATRDSAAATLRRAQARHLAIRPLLDTMYAHRPVRLSDETLVCRCEEVTAGHIRHAAALGCLGLNQLKAFTRCGMGPCQGRMCGATAAEVLAAARGVATELIGPLRTRFPTKPLTVGELAGLG